MYYKSVLWCSFERNGPASKKKYFMLDKIRNFAIKGDPKW